jgi:hypothetical protein
MTLTLPTLSLISGPATDPAKPESHRFSKMMEICLVHLGYLSFRAASDVGVG